MLPAHYNKKETSYFCRFTFGQFFTILVLEIFTLFFIFYLGARYGREFLGIVPPAPVAEKNPNLPQVTTTAETSAPTTVDPEIKSLARDILEKTPSSDLKQRVEGMLQASAEKRERENGERKTESGEQKTENREQKVESREPKADNKEPVIQTAPQNARYTIQVGSYNNVEEAHTMVERWQTKGYPAYFMSADIPGKGRWYRVRVGGFDAKETAQAYLEEFKKKEGVDAFVSSNF